MYPLNLHHKAGGGFAVANDEAEHAALSDAGYEPKLEKAADEAETLRAKLDASGIAYDKRWGVEKLRAALPK
jgi:hypothetical protein